MARIADLYIRRRPRILRGPHIERPAWAPVLRTRRLRLRPHRMGDALEWWEMENQESVRRQLGWPRRDRLASRTHLRHRTRHNSLRQADDFLALGVERNGRLIGDVSLHLRTVYPESRAVEIGWLFDERCRGQGFATEAGAALLTFAFETLAAQWVFAVSDSANESSLSLASRLGLSEASRTEHHTTLLITAVQWEKSGQTLRRRYGIAPHDDASESTRPGVGAEVGRFAAR